MRTSISVLAVTFIGLIAPVSMVVVVPMVVAAPATQPSDTSAPTQVKTLDPVDPSVGLRLRADFTFDGVPLVDVLDYIASGSGINLIVNWNALEEIGIDRSAPVSLKLKQVTYLTALRFAMQGVSDQIGFDVDENIVIITTRELADSRMITRIYPIDDLLTLVPDFDNAPQFSLQGGGGGGSGGGGGGGSLFGGGGGGNGGGNSSGNGSGNGNETTREERAQQVIDTLQATIVPDVWDVNGGRATIKYINGVLVVTAPVRVHGLFRK